MPSGLKATLVTDPVPVVRALRVRASWPVAASHTFTVSSALGGGEALAVGAEGHARDLAGVPLEGEGLLARRPRPRPSPSRPRSAEARRLPSGLKATLMTGPVCPWRVRASWPVAASQTLTVLSAPAEARRLPSGLKATLVARNLLAAPCAR